VLEAAHRAGLVAAGISFHVGSQQRNTEAWDAAVASASAIFRIMAERGIRLSLVNLGGGFPARYRGDEPAANLYGVAIRESILRHFGNVPPETIIEPGRGMVGSAGILKTEVVLIARKDPAEELRWVYLDIGKFGGLAETMDEAIRYPIRSTRDGAEAGPCVLAGPTCDSADVLYEKTPYLLPLSLEIGDELLIEGTGAYTTTYASVGFNGFAPLQSFVI
jgi:ornithine decarboxylase